MQRCVVTNNVGEVQRICVHLLPTASPMRIAAWLVASARSPRALGMFFTPFVILFVPDLAKVIELLRGIPCRN